MSKAKKRGPGRPPIQFDLDVVEGLGRIGATVNDMVHVLPASKRTIAERMADTDGGFRTAYERGRWLQNPSLRRKQIQVAMTGNVTMLIWLGKQHLGQQDKVIETKRGMSELTEDERIKGEGHPVSHRCFEAPSARCSTHLRFPTGGECDDRRGTLRAPAALADPYQIRFHA